MQSLLYFLLWAGFFVLMMRFGCGSHVFGHGHGHGHGHDHDDTRSAGMGMGGTASEEARDPVCGMTVKTAAAKSSIHEGRVYYFCSATCRDKFEAAPGQYAQAAGPASPAKEHHHAC